MYINVYISRKRSCETHQNENWIAKVLNNIKRKQCGNRRHLVRWKAKTSNKLSTVTMDTQRERVFVDVIYTLAILDILYMSFA